MKKIITLLLYSVIILVSCMQNIDSKIVNIAIPMHPWEENSSQKMWYTLRWTCGEEILSRHVDTETRTLSISIPTGETVFICAYPLGEMVPFATAVTPLDDKLIYVLNQNDGYLAKEFMDIESGVRSRINFNFLLQACYSKTEDFRKINMVDLLQDALNGHITKTSVKIKSPVEIPPLSVLDGIWISENLNDNLLNIDDSKTPVLYLNPGIHRYYCPEINREIRITVDYDGTTHSVMRQAVM